MKYSCWIAGVPLMFACTLVLPGIVPTNAVAESTSSCVKCHLDEDMIEDSLAEVKAKKSAKQAGAG